MSIYKKKLSIALFITIILIGLLVFGWSVVSANRPLSAKDTVKYFFEALDNGKIKEAQGCLSIEDRVVFYPDGSGERITNYIPVESFVKAKVDTIEEATNSTEEFKHFIVNGSFELKDGTGTDTLKTLFIRAKKDEGRDWKLYIGLSP